MHLSFFCLCGPAHHSYIIATYLYPLDLCKYFLTNEQTAHLRIRVLEISCFKIDNEKANLIFSFELSLLFMDKIMKKKNTWI